MPPQPAGPSSPPLQVTAAEISRIAGVTRATVSNWRRRHEDFPAPAGGTETSPLYDLQSVQEWLGTRGHTSAAAPDEELRTALRLQGPRSGIAARLLPLVLAASQHTAEELEDLAAATDEELTAAADRAAGRLPAVVPAAADVHYGPGDAAAVRALLACVREQGPQAALDVLAERELDEGPAAGTYRTPYGLAELMASLLPAGVGSVLDPACGSGTFLVAAAGKGARELFGQDTLPVQAQRTAVRLLLAGGLPENAVAIRAGDSLRADAFPGLSVDAVLTNPPFGDREWGHEELAYDPRWAYGVPTRFESELAWVQHCLAHLRPGGYAVMLLPPALAFRASGRRIRAELVRSGAIRAIMALPAGVAQPLHIGLQIWVLQRPEPGGTERAAVLFVNGEPPSEGEASQARGTRGGSRIRQEPVDWAALTARVLTPWAAYSTNPDAFTDVPGVARAVPVVDLLDDLVDLNPARHVRASASDVDPAALAGRLAKLQATLSEHLAALADAARFGDWPPAESPAAAAAWRTATVSDLARGGALTLLRGATPAPQSRGTASTSHRPQGGTATRVLTGADIATGGPPSGDPDRIRTDPAQVVTVAEGDVVLRGDFPRGTGPYTTAQVADATQAGALLGAHLHILRPDPARLDPWFLAGFLGAEGNIAAASSGASIMHVNPGRLRVPLLPLEEQRRYGCAFRHVHDLRESAHRTAELATEAAAALSNGLTVGALLPPPDANV
ncbi:N-6 DNA methylase [Streptomyces sp. AP-93]|uniref:N-6 DNA methylase n=1 Tax=Streptomyces sp. AP-93 TaxID=2929048 RepID=UPI001FB0435A|nr:N-6 DNA methylase [Streptomyces sp. AP-93]MCJ0871520.1 N-6 DNA methylase [Streptomyces sp. AP-93]